MWLLNTFVINFAEPPGSSPKEIPPANTKICACFISSAKTAIDSLKCFGLKFLNTKDSTSAPASLKALIVSYSPFVPGR